MLTVTRNGNEYTAKCGAAEVVLPIATRVDPKTRTRLTEVLSASGVRGLFRIAVGVNYEEQREVAPDGVVTTKKTPAATVYSRMEDLIAKLASDLFGHQLVRISRIRNPRTAGSELARIMRKTMNVLWKQGWDWDESTSFEAYANAHQAVVLDGELPQVPGKFLAELETERKLHAAQALNSRGLLSSPCATGCGTPGSSFYLTGREGYTVTERTNPLVQEMPEKRRGVVNAVKNAVEIVGEEPSYVDIQGVNRTPPMTNAVVVCLPMALDDSVIISESVAKRLTARISKSNWHNIDGVINYRGGLRSTGRNGRMVKREAEWAVSLQRLESLDGHISFNHRAEGLNAASQPMTNLDAGLLCDLRKQYEAKYSGMISRLGAYSAEECRCWREWLAKQPRWTARHPQQPMNRRFQFGVERVVFEDSIFYREDLGYTYRQPETGMKIQSDGDLFKGVVSKILPDDKMPQVKLAGKLVRAEVVCEMGKSVRKHGSLRFAHGQIALYAIARHLGGLGTVGHPSLEDVSRLAVETGVYEDEDLTAEVLDATGTVCYGRFPAGVTRVCRHRQDPSVVSSTKGCSTDRPWIEPNSIRNAGVVNGFADTACLIAAGLKQCARELRSEIPTSTMIRLEVLRNAVC